MKFPSRNPATIWTIVLIAIQGATGAASPEEARQEDFMMIAAFDVHQEICADWTPRFSAGDRMILLKFSKMRGVDPSDPAHTDVLSSYTRRMRSGIEIGEQELWCKAVHEQMNQILNNVAGH